jgi:hypothetical protein
MKIVKKTLAGSFFTLLLLAAGCGTIAPKAATGLPGTAPTITIQPASRTVTAGEPATFSVLASGVPTLTYQWRENGISVTGANSASYTTAATTASDKGTQFTVVVKNNAGSVTSNPASLTVSKIGTLVLSSSTSSLNFGNVSISSSSTQDIILTNAGSSDVTISQVLVAGAGFNSTASNGLTLAPGQITTLTSTFAPSASGAATGKVTVSSNASNSPSNILLSGTGVAAGVHSVVLSWTGAVAGVTGYNAYASTVSGGPFVKMTSMPLAGPRYTDTSVQPDRTYYYVITALNASNQESAFSSEVTAIVP